MPKYKALSPKHKKNLRDLQHERKKTIFAGDGKFHIETNKNITSYIQQVTNSMLTIG